MQSLLGFWIFLRQGNLINAPYAVFYADDGFGNLTPSPCPTHVINDTKTA